MGTVAEAAQTAPSPAAKRLSNPAMLLTVFDEVLRAVAHGEGQDAALLLIAEKVRLLTDCTSSAVALVDSDRETLTFTAVSGAEAQEIFGSRVLLTDTLLGKTARSGEPYLTYRPQPSETLETSAGIYSAAAVAIFSEGQPVGVVAALNKREGSAFGGGDVLALTALAAAASVVLRDTVLQADALRQGRELSTLYEAVRSVSGQLSAQEVLRAVAEQAASHMENRAVVVFLANDERTHLYIAEEVGFQDIPEQREVTLSAENGFGLTVLGTSLPLSITFVNPEEDSGFLPREMPGDRNASGTFFFESPFRDLGARCGLAAAIRSGEAIHGFVLVLSTQAPGVYSRADANLLSALASQAAVAMENAWLYEDATRRAAEAAALYELSQAVTSTLRLPQVLDRIADSVLSLLGVDKFALFLHDSRLKRLKMVVERGLPSGISERVQPGIGQGIPGWVMEFETPTAVQDVAADHRNASAPLHTEGVVSMTCMPLQSGVSTIGVLCALSSRRRQFTVAEMELLYTIANQAAIAIENARVYADVQQKSRELRKYFHRVSRALGSSRSPEAVPALIVSLTQEITSADYCALYSTPSDALTLRDLNDLRDNGSSRLISEASIGMKVLEAPTAPDAETPAQWVARRGRALAISNLEDDDRFRSSALRPARGKVASYMGVPLRAGPGRSNVVGVLEVYTRDRRDWRTEEVRLLLAFAFQAAVALQSARVQEQSEGKDRRAAALASLLTLATQKEKTADSVRVLGILRLLLGSGAGLAVLRRATATESWRLIAVEGLSPERSAEVVSEFLANGAGYGVTSRDENTYLYLGEEVSLPLPARETFLPVLQAAVEILSNASS
ncbi:MAG: GAF domain-containing protein [Cytophagales bacterium]|nr:GAF domain-containing protein [Armatimonadota bacterium]